ncbi:Longin-like domain-containing protein [Pelagophyceae sp. CCMP2097]|nr:Longin-like domain-containing protein [Pelagophyceae sp. CCMP2097]|mmetsp:Transcript_13668/g.45592  ORF Transcript_13668/g.45592 Transcript_13668/m.45592 type:complete len:228 (-) Transcript_13668:117-800(-)
MILLVFIARVHDGMLLVASMDSMGAAEAQDTLDVYKSQAKQLLKQLGDNQAESKCSVESGPFVFHYVIQDGVCYLALTRKGYPKRLAFRFLDDMGEAFVAEARADHGADWRSAVETVARPYAYIKFDKTIQRKRKDYADPSARNNQTKIDEDIADIHSIMKRNIDEVLNRGERLEHLVETTSNLKSEAHKYKWGAKKYSALVLWQQYAPLVAVGVFVLVVSWIKLRW